MVKILLICTIGISTMKVQEKMIEHAEKLNIDVEILAIADSEKKEMIPKADIILLGPQIRFTMDQIKAQSGETIVKVMDSQHYGLLRGDLILEDALESLGILV